ncbi:aldehyde dehydrogenase family protein [Kibdelosporangium phytohabitans]|uniref:Gamma-glutamyl phosphate reductase n=1 Tax=Kibdelosporangium phytohabitans TaxID=860235 RepID=A0A0N9HUG9_9PSEU|nr:aldehyde dehydrogenase family protein [Kibdelosporangium phytohabitans]ALG07157.1 gamma-glutamyl phosphate reductase [Kibdelosporangium phytohabitans]MBE1468490.1 glutamate-5-semialdehyde dehydrogenase [Kibdelosporangium phytohabitans]
MVDQVVEACARAAKQAAPSLAAASEQAIDAALTGMAQRLRASATAVLDANAEDIAAAKAGGMSAGLLDRLTITEARLTAMADALDLLAGVPHAPRETPVRDLPDGLKLVERRRPVGVIGANYEARPNVTVDVASQLVKSRNAGVLRTGSAALGSATALVRAVIAPALAEAGIDPAVIQLVPSPDRAAAAALVRFPDLVPLVILRGSGDSTRELGFEAAKHGVRTLAHADGGGVLYLDADADLAKAHDLIARSLDRLGVCNRLNLLLIDATVYADVLQSVVETLDKAGVRPSLPPHDHPIGYEWALDSDHEATVTISPVDDAVQAAQVANEKTSGLAAGIVTENSATAEAFMSAYTGTGVFWNATTRLLDGFKLLAVPETGINIDKVPGPRGPVTYTDLSLRQYAVVPAQ